MLQQRILRTSLDNPSQQKASYNPQHYPWIDFGWVSMRVAVVTYAARKIGGTETYIEGILPALERAGHQVAIVFEAEDDLTRPPIRIPSKIQCWSVQDHGPDVAVMRLLTWAPDVIYSHGLTSPELEGRIQQVAPSVFYAHSLYGQCISGFKCFRRPRHTTCTRTFGPACLAHYLPRGCGGHNPLQMFRDYSRQSARLKLLRLYRRVVTNSEYVVSELARHTISAEIIPLFASKSPSQPPAIGDSSLPAGHDPWQLLFLGRADSLKGGDILLKSLPLVAKSIDRPLSLTFAASGPALSGWKQIAEKIRCDRISLDFLGWSSHTEELFQRSHLLVVPSICPESFGLGGIEAGSFAVPAVAFANGGIPEWLRDGENGYLAQTNPPTAQKLADGIVRCLSDPDHYLRLRAGALLRAREYSFSRHVNSLLAVFDQVVHPATNSGVRVAVR